MCENEAILAIHVLEVKAACVLFFTRFDSGSTALLLDRLVQTELCLNRQGVNDCFVTVKVKFNAKNIPESTGQSKPKPWERRRTEYTNDTRWVLFDSFSNTLEMEAKKNIYIYLQIWFFAIRAVQNSDEYSFYGLPIQELDKSKI